MNSTKKREWLKYAVISVMASLDACLVVLLVQKNEFAPTNIIGITTMIQYIFGFQSGYQYLIANIPIVLVAFFKLDRAYAVKNAFYITFFSVVSLLVQNIIAAFGLHNIQYTATSSEALFLLAMAYGSFEGIAYSTVVMLGGSTGGIDMLAALTNKYKPRFNTVWIMFTIKVLIASVSYFVYGRKILPVIVSVVCGFAGSVVSDTILKGRGTALKFEVITENPAELASELMQKLGHGVTCVQSMGMYQNTQNSLLICVVNKRQRYDFEQIISGHKNTFAYCCPVKCTYGHFER